MQQANMMALQQQYSAPNGGADSINDSTLKYLCDFNIASTNSDPIQNPTGTPTAPIRVTSNIGIGEGCPSQHRLSKQNEGAKAPQTYNMLPTDITVLGDFFNANDHYENHVNQFGLHKPDACGHYAAGMLIRTSGAHEQFSSSEFVGGLSTININLFNIHTWVILDPAAVIFW